METLIIHTEKEKLSVLKDFLKSMDINFEVTHSKLEGKKKKEKPYDPTFIKKILDTKSEKSIRVNTSNLWESIL